MGRYTGGGGYLPLPVLIPLTGASIDLWFETGRYWDVTEGVPVTNYVSCVRASTAYASNAAGVFTSFGTDTLRITDLGLMVEDARTNVVLQNRDLTNAAWTKTNMTAALDQTGIDNGVNSASSITATAGNATVLQSITLASSDRFQSAYVKRITGSGTVNMTMDNGTTWTAITVTSNWTLVTIPAQTLANPTVGFRIVTSGDAIAVDFVQNEDSVFATSPILTAGTAVTRAADAVSVIGSAKTILDNTQGSFYISYKLTSISGLFTRLIGTESGSISFSLVFSSTQMDSFNGVVELFSTYGGGQTPTGGAKTAFGWDVSGRSQVGGGGTVTSDANTFGAATVLNPKILRGNAAASNGFGFCRRLALWPTRQGDSTLQGFTV